MENINLDYNPDNDFLLFHGDSTVRKFIRDETVLFSDELIKVNKYGMKQERNILITNKAVYNLQNRDLKRRIEYSSIKGISVTKDTDEFIIHCNDLEYDYYFHSGKKKKIIQILDTIYLEKIGKVIPLCALDLKTIYNYVTTKDEKKKDINLSRMPESGLITVSDYLLGKGFSKTLKRVFSKKTGKDDYRFLKLLGKGTHSKIFLAEYSSTTTKIKELFAIKRIRKDVIIENELFEAIGNEANILNNLEHSFLLEMFDSFDDEKYVYFVISFMKGGDLFEYLKSHKIDLQQIKTLASQIISVISFLHEAGIVYRDLRPENILLDENGFIKLCDFGITKQLSHYTDLTGSFAGAPEYLSPEIILGQGHNKNTDWWGLGVLLYEMAYGFPPFFNQNTDIMYEMICNGDVHFEDLDSSFYPNKAVNPTLFKYFTDLIRKLLIKDYSKRIGSKDEIEDFKTHPFFEGVNFELVTNKKIDSLINPCQKSEIFTQHNNGVVSRRSNSVTATESQKDFDELLENFDQNLINSDINDDSLIFDDEIAKLNEENKQKFEKMLITNK